MEHPNYYAVIPAHVRYSKDISDGAKLLYAEITALSNKWGYCIATNGYFSELYGKSEVTISRIISSLKKAGFLDIQTEITSKGTLRKIYPLGVIKNDKGGSQKRQGGVIKNDYHNNTSINTKCNSVLQEDTHTHTFPDSKPSKVYDPNDKRKNKQLPFDLVSGHETMKAMYPDAKILQKEYLDLYGYNPDIEIIKHCMNTFITSGIASYYQTIRTLDKYKSLLYTWITREIKHRRNVKKQDPQIQPIYSFKTDISNA